MNENCLNEFYEKQKKIKKRLLLITIRQFIDIQVLAICYIVYIPFIRVILFVLPTNFLGIFLPLFTIIGGMILLKVKITPFAMRLCHKYFWKILKINIIRKNFILVTFLEVIFLAYLLLRFVALCLIK